MPHRFGRGIGFGFEVGNVLIDGANIFGSEIPSTENLIADLSHLIHLRMRLSKFFRSKFSTFFSLLAIGMAMILWSPDFVTFSLHRVFGTIAAPFQGFTSFLGFQFHGVTSFFESVGSLKSENERLSSENLDLLAENALLRDEAKENERLRKEIDLLPRDRFSFRAAEVIGQDSASSGGWIVIRSGAQNGTRVGMPVVVGKGMLIGRIVEVSAFSAKVLLLSDSSSAVNAVDELTGARGIVKGEYGTGLTLDMVLPSDSLAGGDTVITSGLGGEFPRGLLIGSVNAVRPSPDQLFQQASIVPPIRYRELTVVFILTETRS